MIFLKLKLHFSLFGVGLGWFLEGFWEGLGKVWLSFLKVSEGLGRLGRVWEGFGKIFYNTSLEFPRHGPPCGSGRKKLKFEEGGRPDGHPFQTQFDVGLHSTSHENIFDKLANVNMKCAKQAKMSMITKGCW